MLRLQDTKMGRLGAAKHENELRGMTQTCTASNAQSQ